MISDVIDWLGRQQPTLLIALFGAITGGIGLGLSIYNAWYARRKDRPRFRLEVAIERTPNASDLIDKNIGRSVGVRIVNSGMIDLYIENIWLTRSRLKRLKWWRKPKFWEVGRSNPAGRRVLADAIKPGNDLSVTISGDSLEGALSRGMHTFFVRTKTGKVAEVTPEGLCNLEVVEVHRDFVGDTVKRIRLRS